MKYKAKITKTVTSKVVTYIEADSKVHAQLKINKTIEDKKFFNKQQTFNTELEKV